MAHWNLRAWLVSCDGKYTWPIQIGLGSGVPWVPFLRPAIWSPSMQGRGQSIKKVPVLVILHKEEIAFFKDPHLGCDARKSMEWSWCYLTQEYGTMMQCGGIVYEIGFLVWDPINRDRWLRDICITWSVKDRRVVIDPYELVDFHPQPCTASKSFQASMLWASWDHDPMLRMQNWCFYIPIWLYLLHYPSIVVSISHPIQLLVKPATRH